MLKVNRLRIGLGFVIVFVTTNGIHSLAIPFYQMILGMNPLVLAVILTFPLLTSALLSNRIGKFVGEVTSQKYGRKYLVITSGLICACSYGAVWNIPQEFSHTQLIFYFLMTSLVFAVSSTFLSISITCMAYEQANESQETTRVMGFAAFFDKFSAVFYCWLFPLAHSSLFSDINQGMRAVGWTISILFIGLFALIVALLPEGATTKKLPEQPSQEEPLDFPSKLQPTLELLIVVTVIQFGLIGACVSMDYYVLVYHMFFGDVQLGAFWKSVLTTGYAIAGLLSIPVIIFLCGLIGKKRTLILIIGLNCINAILKWFIFEPGNEYFIVLDAVTGTWIWSATGIIVPAMLADICYQAKTKNVRKTISFVVAKQNKARNIGIFIATLCSGLVLNVIGFDTLDFVDTRQSMKLILSIGSLVFSLLILLLVTKINTQTLRENIRKL